MRQKAKICLWKYNPWIFLYWSHKYTITWKNEKYSYCGDTMDYIANSKNRKFKKQILVFLDRIHFWTWKLPPSWKFILMLTCILWISLFFPWLQFEYLNNDTESYSAFSYYVWYIGYSIILALIIIPFFLLSHTKKETIRSLVPFRLSDTQVIIFITSIILANLFHLLSMIRVFWQFATPSIDTGIILALTASFCIIICGFFLSKQTKEDSIEMRHFDHQERVLPDEYAEILGKKNGKSDTEKGNMVLPI